MYRYSNGQISLSDFKQPVGMNLMAYFRKRLTSEVLGEINEMILRDAMEQNR